MFLKPKKPKILTYGAKKTFIIANKLSKTGTKFTTAFFYVTDSNSHNLLTGECAIELYLICLHHTTSDKRDDSAKLQEMYVANEKNVRANKISLIIRKLRRV